MNVRFARGRLTDNGLDDNDERYDGRLMTAKRDPNSDRFDVVVQDPRVGLHIVLRPDAKANQEAQDAGEIDIFYLRGTMFHRKCVGALTKATNQLRLDHESKSWFWAELELQHPFPGFDWLM